eukprot:scaffold30141_cov29-Tisochrysis_lutea.AAC.1
MQVKRTDRCLSSSKVASRDGAEIPARLGIPTSGARSPRRGEKLLPSLASMEASAVGRSARSSLRWGRAPTI